MNSRPKLLHATTYDEGMRLFENYKTNVMAVISDAGIERRGRHEPDAGIRFIRHAIAEIPGLPVLIQSSNQSVAVTALEAGAAFVDKESPHLLAQLRNFLSTNLGFGDFVFRSPDGRELDVAQSVRELEQKMVTIPEGSIVYHAGRNHFSQWMLARSEFELAEDLRLVTVDDFKDGADGLRRYIIAALRAAQEGRRGVIADFDRDQFEAHLMNRLGDGAMGGKARGIAFLYNRLSELGDISDPALPVRFPKSTIIASGYFDEFMNDNHLAGFAHISEDDEALAQRFLEGPSAAGSRERPRFHAQPR